MGLQSEVRLLNPGVRLLKVLFDPPEFEEQIWDRFCTMDLPRVICRLVSDFRGFVTAVRDWGFSG